MLFCIIVGGSLHAPLPGFFIVVVCWGFRWHFVRSIDTMMKNMRIIYFFISYCISFRLYIWNCSTSDKCWKTFSWSVYKLQSNLLMYLSYFLYQYEVLILEIWRLYPFLLIVWKLSDHAVYINAFSKKLRTTKFHVWIFAKM